MLSFKDITDYYDLSEHEATVLRFIIDSAAAEPGLVTTEHVQPSSSIANEAQSSLPMTQADRSALN